MLDPAIVSRPLALMLCALLLVGCGDQGDEPAGDIDLDDYGAGLDPEDDSLMPGAAEANDTAAAAAEKESADALGSLTVRDAATPFELTVTDCSMISAPSKDAAIATLRLDAFRASEPGSSADRGPFTLEFQIQELPGVSGVALLGFESEADNLLYTGKSGQAQPGSYTLTVGGSDFDVTSGNNGALEPVGSGFAEPLPVAVESSFSVAAQQLTDNDAAPLRDATLAVTLTSRCALSWRLDP